MTAAVPPPLPSRADIVACLRAERRGLHAREIASRCHVPESSYRRLLELLDQLSLDRTIGRTAGNRFKAQRGLDGGAQWEGLLSVHPRGFGFVASAGHEDVYVAPDGIGGALHGDRVRVSVIGRSARGTEGRIEAIGARRNPRVAGVLHKRRKSAWLEPDDSRVRGPIVLGHVPEQGSDGAAAVVQITRFPESADENAEGELVAVLGAPGDPNAEVAKILVREQIEEDHPEAALREAEGMAAKVLRAVAPKRRDLREVPLLTIDPVDARDHDDAVWAERSGDGYRLWVAIADVSEYVQPGSALDAEARARGVTIYLPDRAIPMLPAALASDLCSLLPEQERLCLCVIADLDKNGTVKRVELVEGLMRAAAMMTYGGVARALGLSAEQPKSPQAEAFKRDLKVFDELARKLRRARLRRGALDFDLPEAQVLLDPTTCAPVGVQRRASDPGVKQAYQIIEELMILANEAVARWLSKHRCPTVYRVHDKPDPMKLDRLGEVCHLFGAPFDIEQMTEPKGVAKWLGKIAAHPKKHVLEMLLLRSMKQAVYDIANIGHFGLGSTAYLHFTSPIRRYPDVEVHRGVKRLLRGAQPDTSPAAIETLRASATLSSERERAAMEVEREVVDLYRALYMRDRIGDLLEGTVTAVVGSGLYVTLDEPFVDVLVRYDALGPDFYELGDDELSAVGLRSGDRVELGDRIVVSIEDVAVLRRTILAKRVVPEKLSLADRKGRGKRSRESDRRKPPPRKEPGRPQGERGRSVRPEGGDRKRDRPRKRGAVTRSR